jgi:MoxR-like ATPase
MADQQPQTDLEALRSAFLERWPADKLASMTLEEYSNRDQTSFTYWLEFKGRGLGSIKGGSSMKFLVYNRKDRSEHPPKSTWQTDGIYAWYSTLGSTAHEAFEVVKEELVRLVNAGIAMNLEEVAKPSLFGEAMKWKLASMYNLDAIYPVFKLSLANDMLRVAGGSSVSSLIEAQSALRDLKPADETPLQFMHGIYQKLELQANQRFEGEHMELIDNHPQLDLLEPLMGSRWFGDCTTNEWRAALEAGEELISLAGLEEGDSRLVFSLRDDNSRQRVAVLMGSQLLYSFGIVDDVPTVRFQVPKGSDLPEGASWDSFQPSIGIGAMVRQPVSHWTADEPWLSAVSAVAREELSRSKSSRYQSSHRPFLHQVFCDEDVRESFITYATSPVESKMVEVYKRLLVVRGIEDELYKWDIFAKFQAEWDLQAKDFATMRPVMNFKNLIHQTATSFWNALWQDPELARSYYVSLADESASVKERLVWAASESKTILQKVNPDWKSSGQDERGVSLFWAASDLATHAPYKYSFYSEYCYHIRSDEAGRQEKYSHYLDLMNAFVHNWVQEDDELLEAQARALEGTPAVHDPNHHLLGQNIWYTVLEQVWDEENEDDHQRPDNVDSEPEEGGLLGSNFLGESFLQDVQVAPILAGLKRKKNIILQGPPGTGKTFVAKLLAHAVMKERDDSRIEVVQFHQSYSYEDFIQGFRPKEEGGFERRDGVFYRFCDLAREDLERPYFFVIDEINRGNLSKIFGELMMLIEADKRGEKHEVQLTYSEEDEHFSIPPNVHLIGTMNTADRSLALVDYALRRRFLFFDIAPQFDSPKFKAHLLSRGVSEPFVDELKERMKSVNKSIEKDPNLGKGFEIGHSYFCGRLKEGLSATAWFHNIVKHEVGPQLHEYWFDDKGKAENQVNLLLMNTTE